LSPADRARVDELLDAMRVPPAGFGGWQFAQVLTDGRSVFRAIDWGNLGAYWPCHDLASAVCSLDDFGADAAPRLRPTLLDAFSAGAGLDADEEAALQRWLDLWTFFDRAARVRAGLSPPG
jgi:Ser/Thr protein kinase RdoA (MazF antagonist)